METMHSSAHSKEEELYRFHRVSQTVHHIFTAYSIHFDYHTQCQEVARSSGRSTSTENTSGLWEEQSSIVTTQGLPMDTSSQLLSPKVTIFLCQKTFYYLMDSSKVNNYKLLSKFFRRPMPKPCASICSETLRTMSKWKWSFAKFSTPGCSQTNANLTTPEHTIGQIVKLDNGTKVISIPNYMTLAQIRTDG